MGFVSRSTMFRPPSVRVSASLLCFSINLWSIHPLLTADYPTDMRMSSCWTSLLPTVTRSSSLTSLMSKPL